MAQPDNIYDAQGEYLKSQKGRPGNVPAHLMAKIRAASLQQLVNPAEAGDNIGGFSKLLLHWGEMKKLEKIEAVAELELGEVRALLGSEDDNDVLLVLVKRKKDIEASFEKE